MGNALLNSKSGGTGTGEDTQTKTGMGITFPSDHNYALLIGVGKHSNPNWSLPVTVNDVYALHHLLVDPKRCGYPPHPPNMRMLVNEMATGHAILSSLQDLADYAANDSEANLLIYYTGHGWLDASGRYFLIPHDAQIENLAETALSADRFIEALRVIHSQRLLVILDTCHAEGMATAKEISLHGFHPHAVPEAVASTIVRGTSRAVFSSCLGEESSWILPDQSLSVFTHHLLEAFNGAGTPAGARHVTIANLMAHIGPSVEATAARLGKSQHPFFKFEAEAFPVALPGRSNEPSDSRPEGVHTSRTQNFHGEVGIYSEGGGDIHIDHWGRRG